MRYKLVIFGVKNTSEIIIQHLIESGEKIDLIVSLDKTILDDYHISGYKDLSKVAYQNDIEYLPLKDYSLNNPDDLSFFKNNFFDIGIAYGWQRLIPEDVLKNFIHGIYGFHGSSKFLPEGKGRSPLNWSLIENRNIIHHHLFKYKSGPDEGPVVNISDFEITPFDSILTLQYKAIITAKYQINILLKDYKKNNIKEKNQKGESTFYKKRKPKDGKIDFSKTTTDIYNLIRAVTKPFPGAFCYINNTDTIYIWEAYPFDSKIDLTNFDIGEVVEILFGMPVIKTTDGSMIFKSYESEIKLKKKDVLY